MNIVVLYRCKFIKYKIIVQMYRSLAFGNQLYKLLSLCIPHLILSHFVANLICKWFQYCSYFIPNHSVSIFGLITQYYVFCIRFTDILTIFLAFSVHVDLNILCGFKSWQLKTKFLVYVVLSVILNILFVFLQIISLFYYLFKFLY